jgi:hypothetical protein
MAMTVEQRGVVAGVIAAVLVTAFTLIACCLVWSPTEAQASSSYRMTLFAAAASAPCLTLMVSIARLANHRFFTAQDIGGSASPNQTEAARLLQALIQNTLEQSVLGLAAYALWCILAPASFLPAAPAAAALFFIGRILFFVRYEGGAAARSFGFAVTFYPTVALTVGNTWFAVNRILSTLHGA